MLTNDTGGQGDSDGSRRDISDIFRIRHLKDSIKIRSPENKAVTISSRCNAFLHALSTFSDDGKPLVSNESILQLVEKETGRNIEFMASDLLDMAMLISSLCVGDKTVFSMPEPAPLPSALFDKPEPPSREVPSWIADNPEFKPRLVVDDGDIVLDFMPIAMNAKSKYQVDGRGEPGVSGRWGYEAIARGRRFGWVVILDPGCILVTGVSNNKYSKHRTMMSAMFRLSTYHGTANADA